VYNNLFYYVNYYSSKLLFNYTILINLYYEAFVICIDNLPFVVKLKSVFCHNVKVTEVAVVIIVSTTEPDIL
jgi:hypothetical protein